MPILDNPRHELFAQGLSKGLGQRDAYLNAGFSTANDESTDACASRLATYDDVTARVKEIQDKAARRVELDRMDILQMLIEDRLLARANDQSSAAIRATELLGKEIANMFVEKKEIKTGILDSVDASQLERLRETLAAERDRRVAEGNGEGGEREQDRKVLPGPRTAAA